MKRFLVAVFAVFIGFGAMAEDAEAKRFGGGKSSGMQRSMDRKAAPQRNVDQAPARQPGQAAGAAPRKNGWLGPIAGLAAGLGLAALFSHLGFGEGMANFVTILLLALVAFMVIRFIMNRMRPKAPAAAYAGAAPSWQPAPRPQSFEPAARSSEPVMPGAAQEPVWQSAAQPVAANVPPGFDKAGFEREAKLNFIRLQAAFDAGNLDDLREFTSPEMYAEVKLQLAERGNVAQTTEVVSIDAEVLESVQDGNRYVTSVRFTGLVREEVGAEPVAVDEVWHLTKPLDGRTGWVVAGIQQNG